METRHRHHDDAGEPHGHDHGHDENWSDEEFVAQWIERQKARAPERQRLFAKLRAMIPKAPSQEFRYANLGAGAGELDEMILDRFPKARAVLVDSSAPMLAQARKHLGAFGGRVEYVQADLSSPEWTARAGGPFDVVLATRAVHHVGGPSRIRDLLGEVLGVVGPGGLFINLDYVRLGPSSFEELATWAAADPEAGFQTSTPRMALPSSVEEHLDWLREVGFAAAECVYREFQAVILVAIRDQIRWPEGTDLGGRLGERSQ